MGRTDSLRSHDRADRSIFWGVVRSRQPGQQQQRGQHRTVQQAGGTGLGRMGGRGEGARAGKVKAAGPLVRSQE